MIPWVHKRNRGQLWEYLWNRVGPCERCTSALCFIISYGQHLHLVNLSNNRSPSIPSTSSSCRALWSSANYWGHISVSMKLSWACWFYNTVNEMNWKWMWFPDLELTDVQLAGELSWWSCRNVIPRSTLVTARPVAFNRHNLIHPDIFCRIKTVKNPRSIFDTNYRLIQQSCLFICYFISRIIPDILGKWRHTSAEFPKLAAPLLLSHGSRRRFCLKRGSRLRGEWPAAALLGQ